MHKQYRWLEHIMLLVAGMAGFAGAPPWFVLLAAAGLTIEDWAKLWPLRSPAVTLSTKMITYFVTGVLANIFYAVVSYALGAAARTIL